MSRRAFIFFLGGVVASPLAARAQQPAMPLIGFLHVGTAGADENRLPAAFRRGLKEAGYVEGRNVLIEYRFAEHKADRLPGLASDLVRRQVAVIVVAGGGGITASAAKAATSTIPIVVSIGADPVKLGLAASLQRPGGNITGSTFFSTALGGKRLELLCELLPRAKKIGYLRTGALRTVTTKQQMDDALTAARALGRQLLVLEIDNAEQLDAAFSTLRKERADALLIASEPFFNSTETRDKLVALSLRHAVPAIYPFRDFAVAGGLMSYEASYREAFAQAGIYTGRILKGEKPADLPFQQSTKFELLINLKTARALGINIPQSVLARADEVIE